MDLGESKGYATASTHNHSPGRVYGHNCDRRYHYHLLKMNINGASTIFCLTSCTFKAMCIGVDPWSMYRPPLWAIMLVTISLPPPKNERQWSINDFWLCILDNLRATERRQPIILSSAAFMGKRSSVNITTTSKKWASMERQRFLVSHLWQSKGYRTALTHHQFIGYHYGQKC